VKRRDFLIQTAKATAAASALTGAGIWLAGRTPRVSDDIYHIPGFGIDTQSLPHDLVAAHGTDTNKVIETALQAMGGIERFVSPGDRVLIKPNVGFDRPPILGATTSPEVVRALVRLCIAASASKVIVSDNPINSPAASFGRSGIAAATEAAGGEVRYISERDFEPTAIGGVALGTFDAAAELLRGIDKVIGVPTLKDHNLAGMSFAMKNWYGLLGRGRNRFHQDIHNVVADLAMMITPTLIIGDATRMLVRNGPTGGSPADVIAGNTIIASVDAVAVDAYGMKLLKRPLSDCPSIELAAQRQIGVADLSALRIEEINV
jgi:uncharacterized protein (DUF362 family)